MIFALGAQCGLLDWRASHNQAVRYGHFGQCRDAGSTEARFLISTPLRIRQSATTGSRLDPNLTNKVPLG